MHARRAIVRGLLTAEQAPELLARNEADFQGFEAGRGLATSGGVGLGAVIETALVAEAPGVLGLNTARLPGMITLLFGHFERGRDREVAAELIDLFRPSLLTRPITDTLTIPKLAQEQIEAYFKWWVVGVNRLFAIAADPAMFRKRDGSYDPAGQLGFQLSLERLFATITGILVASRRDEYTRLILSFQAIDLLKGMELGSYDTLAHPGKVAAVVDDLEERLPPGPAAVLLPRCRRAAAALDRLIEGFYFTERIESGQLRLRTKKGASTAVSIDAAAAEYLNLIRDAGHTFRQKMTNEYDLSLFIAHNGVVDPSVADVPFVHLIRLLIDATDLKKRLRRPT